MKKILCFLFILICISSCTNYSNLGLPRGFNGRIMQIIPGSTPCAYVISMYGQPAQVETFEDGSSNKLWTLDTSEGPCNVIIGFTQQGIVNWYNYTYVNALKYRK